MFIDIIDIGYLNYYKVMDICWKWGFENVWFSVWNVFELIDWWFDLVCLMEVFEYIEDVVGVVVKMCEVVLKYVYCLVLFFDKEINVNLVCCKWVFEIYGYFVYGYDVEELEVLFLNFEFIKGVYFDDVG